MNADFYSKTHAKWILSGEHAVLRGYPALVFPLPGKFIEWYYWKTNTPLQVDFNVPHEESLLVLFWNVFDEALHLLNKKQHDVQGQFVFHNTIPMGAGMGFSAAFCVGLTRWLVWHEWLPENQLFTFARQLENFFHGQSSGVDIAGSMYDQGVQFTMPDKLQPIHVTWRPKLYLSYSGHVSVTSKCVLQVKEFLESDPAQATQIDKQMAHSVALAHNALHQPEEKGRLLLREALQLGEDCFRQWDLLNPALMAHKQQLIDAGALAVKPTGAGDGGYMLSLWDKLPDMPFEMIAVF